MNLYFFFTADKLSSSNILCKNAMYQSEKETFLRTRHGSITAHHFFLPQYLQYYEESELLKFTIILCQVCTKLKCNMPTNSMENCSPSYTLAEHKAEIYSSPISLKLDTSYITTFQKSSKRTFQKIVFLFQKIVF